jgi:hypothetical protein
VAIRRVWLPPTEQGPVAVWDGTPQSNSVDHDSIYDQPWSGSEKPCSSTLMRGSRSRSPKIHCILERRRPGLNFSAPAPRFHTSVPVVIKTFAFLAGTRLGRLP